MIPIIFEDKSTAEIALDALHEKNLPCIIIGAGEIAKKICNYLYKQHNLLPLAAACDNEYYRGGGVIFCQRQIYTNYKYKYAK